ncbi:MAG: type II toxin-antitoxin system ParD family antitoxin [Flavobacteriales bacterium]|nr:type II toxin-antitoxin system ParD family antitoxin [Flavobacteriales bacterium]
MSKHTPVSLGSYYEQFIQRSVTEGRYGNISEAIRAALRLLEEEESKTAALRKAIEEGVQSGLAKDFDPEKHLVI